MNPITIYKRSTGIILNYGENKPVLSKLSKLAIELKQLESRYDKRLRRLVTKVKTKWYRHEPELNRILFPGFMEFKLRRLLDLENVEYKWIEDNDRHVIKHKWNMVDTFEFRQGQEKFVEFLTQWDSYTRILPATMGSGKTVCAIASLAVLESASLVVASASVINEFLETIEWATDLRKDQYIYIGGGHNLRAYMEEIIAGPNPYAITLISIETFQRCYLNCYLEDGDWPLTPTEFFDVAGFGAKVVDEAHRSQHFHMITNLYSNIPINIYLTGTLMKEDPFEQKMEKLMYPVKDRCPVPKPTNHVKLQAFHYKTEPNVPPHVGAMGYSHAKMETAILKRKKSLKGYLSMIHRIICRDYIQYREVGDKALVFASKVEMVTAIHEKLANAFPKLNVITYGAGDPKSVLKEADIIISTVKKAGTGTDIPILTYVLQTIPISAKGENFQNVGRLRNLTDKVTAFGYLVCQVISKHIEYHEKRQKELTPLVHKREQIYYPDPIPFK